MAGKITLNTPPDIYENSNFSIMFLGLGEADQASASEWLGQYENLPELNLYYYQNEMNLDWLFYALNRADAKFVDLDSNFTIINYLGSYILGRPDVYYTTKNENLKALMSYINNKYVPNVETFLNDIFNGH